MKKKKHMLVYLGHRGAGPAFSYGLLIEHSKYEELLISQSNELHDLCLSSEEFSTTSFNLPHRKSDLHKIVQIILLIFYCLRNAREVTISMYTPYLFIFAALRPFLKVNYIMHDVVPHSPSFHVSFNQYFASFFCNKIIVLSEYQLARYRYFFRSKLTKIKHPLFHHYKARSFSSRPFDVEFAKYLFFGRLEEYKGLELLDFFPTTGSEVRLNVVGKGTVPDKHLTKPNINIVNQYVPDQAIPSLLSKCEYLVLPYKTATQTGLIPLAATFHKKVLCFDIPVFTEQAEDYSIDMEVVDHLDFEGMSKIILEVSS